MSLDTSKQARALQLMREYLDATRTDGPSPREESIGWDVERVQVIETQLKPMLSSYLDGKLALSDFKSQNDSVNRRTQLWGFRGIKGQMFFNMMSNVTPETSVLDRELKHAMMAPNSEADAAEKINSFCDFARRVGDDWVEAGHSKHERPKVSSVPFFLSYFWQILDRIKWPVYYTNTVDTMSDVNLWNKTGDFGSDYIEYKQIHEELSQLFTRDSGREFTLYDVEHVFWHKGQRTYNAVKRPEIAQSPLKPQPEPPVQIADVLPDSYVPPFLAVLPSLARNDSGLADAAKRSGTTIDQAFEKRIDAAFVILGYETRTLGSGKGRVADGLAFCREHDYAIIWDAKVRSDGYAMGTDDRTVREYIRTHTQKDFRGFRNVYYVIVSGAFHEGHESLIKSIKMETVISEVILLEASALVTMIDKKLRSPMQLSLGPDGLQAIFATSGVVNEESVRETLN